VYDLAAPQTPSEAVAEILERARKGKRVTIAEVRDTIARYQGLDGFDIDDDSEDDDWLTKYLVAKQLIPNGGNDDIQTPGYLANQIVKHFLPLIDVKNDFVLEPCAGKGAFVRALKANGIKNITTCEIKKGQDFSTMIDEWIGSSRIHLSPKCENFLNTATGLPTMWYF
jgi:hypothetical protein